MAIVSNYDEQLYKLNEKLYRYKMFLLNLWEMKNSALTLVECNDNNGKSFTRVSYKGVELGNIVSKKLDITKQELIDFKNGLDKSLKKDEFGDLLVLLIKLDHYKSKENVEGVKSIKETLSNKKPLIKKFTHLVSAISCVEKAIKDYDTFFDEDTCNILMTPSFRPITSSNQKYLNWTNSVNGIKVKCEPYDKTKITGEKRYNKIISLCCNGKEYSIKATNVKTNYLEYADLLHFANERLTCFNNFNASATAKKYFQLQKEYQDITANSCFDWKYLIAGTKLKRQMNAIKKKLGQKLGRYEFWLTEPGIIVDGIINYNNFYNANARPLKKLNDQIKNVQQEIEYLNANENAVKSV